MIQNWKIETLMHCIILMLDYSCREKLNLVLDFENDEVSRHLGQIANSMHEWEGSIAEHLGLTRADVAAIKEEYPGKLKLQM